MKTIEYQLKSDPKKSVIIPAAVKDEAETLTNLATEKPQELANMVDKYLCLTNTGVLAAVEKLVVRNREIMDGMLGGTALTLLQDNLYLRVCINYNEKELYGKNAKMVAKIDSDLINTLQGL